MPDSRPARVALLAVLIAFALLGAVYSAVVPIFEVSDELWHYPMVEHLSRTWQLPVQPLEPGTSSGPWRQEGSQPPLYYALGALLTSWIDTGDMDTVRQPNPHTRAGEITPERDNANLVIHNPDVEGFPWSGTVLAVHLVRLLSVALGTWSVYLTWALIQAILPSSTWVPIAAAAVHAFTPMHLFISSSVNNDNLIVPLSTLALVIMVRRVKQAGRPFDRSTVLGVLGLGCVVGLALLTKASGIALLPLAAAMLVWETWRRPPGVPWRRRLTQLALQLAALLGPALVLAGWWFVRNRQLYGDWLGFNAFYAVLGTRDVPASLAQLWAERFAFAAGYWGNFGGLNVPMPDLAYTLLNGTAVVAGAGLAPGFVTWLLSPRKDAAQPDIEPLSARLVPRLWPFAWDNLTAARALAWVWPVGVFVSWSRWAAVTWSSQGRLIFSALPMWSAALVLGLMAWIPPRLRPVRLALNAALPLLLLALCVVALPAWILPAYRPPAAVDAAPEALGLTPTDIRFGDTLELAGYAVQTETTHPGKTLELVLMWRALTPAPTYRSIFIHILGQGDRIVAQRDTFPGHGRLPATFLTPGTTWIEHHVLPIPATAYAPDTLTVAVGLYETATGTRTVPTGAVVAAGSDTARFGEVALASPDGTHEGTATEVRFGEGIILDRYGLSDLLVNRGEEVTVTLDWLCAARVPDDYTVSVQLIDDRWNKAAQSDAWPLDGQAPTSTWTPGAHIAEARTLTIDPATEPGAYDLRIAIYRTTADGELVHLPVSQDRAAMPATAIVLTQLRIR